jgi:hypothetical protein
MMVVYCRNMQEPERRKKEWYNQCILFVSSNTSKMRGMNIKLRFECSSFAIRRDELEHMSEVGYLYE